MTKTNFNMKELKPYIVSVTSLETGNYCWGRDVSASCALMALFDEGHYVKNVLKLKNITLEVWDKKQTTKWAVLVIH